MAIAACAGEPATHPGLGPILRNYDTLPEERALAVAGELRSERWVAGASGGHASRSEAEAGALRECRKRREKRRLQIPCRLYAVGDQVVWRGP